MSNHYEQYGILCSYVFRFCSIIAKLGGFEFYLNSKLAFHYTAVNQLWTVRNCSDNRKIIDPWQTYFQAVAWDARFAE